MSYSSVSYSANSAANSGKDYTYSFPAVTHDTANILVLVGGTALAITRYTVASSGGTITLEAVPGAGTSPLDVALSASNVLKVYRFTNRTSAEVVFSSTAIIQDEDLNTATDQGRYLALEAVDRANESIAIDEADASRYNVQIDGVDKRIFGIATPTNDKDAVNKAYADTNLTAAASSATAAATSATLAGDWATKADGAVTGSDFSAKAHASVTGANAPAEGSAKEWATLATTPSATATDASAKEWATGVSTHKGEFSAKSYAHVEGATAPTEGSAKEWASSVDVTHSPTAGSAKEWALGGQGTSANTADGSEFAAKEYAQGQTATGGTAKQWALGGGAFVEGTAVTGSSYSAKKQATDAAASAAAAAASFDSFDVRYLGAKSSDPTVDNDGATLLDGALYFNSTANNMRVYDLGTTAWIVIASSLPQGLAVTDTPTFATPTADGHAAIKSYVDDGSTTLAQVASTNLTGAIADRFHLSLAYVLTGDITIAGDNVFGKIVNGTTDISLTNDSSDRIISGPETAGVDATITFNNVMFN